ncbi:hypothetical protein B0T22DRAFT_441577 [Podospora appendiculata]|uniref:Uncharacterized protein n=1 Tax=Podospora appendiculata TaxID=314037 RepID=A0AAE0XCX7_9PEZI|nr:hypothetical protein B0T22DRAFT_441577 [Podospora appendiculata]
MATKHTASVAEGVILVTYLTAFRYLEQAPVSRRFTSNPDRIVEDNLGIGQVYDPSGPYHGSVPSPPIFNAQLEHIMFIRFLQSLSKAVPRDLLTLMRAQCKGLWLIIYLVLFMMLHSNSMVVRKDMEFARRTFLPAS